MLRVALPRPATDAVVPGGSQRAFPGAFDDEVSEAPVHRLTRAEAEALRLAQPALSPWYVVAAQVVTGGVMAAVAGLWSDGAEAAWSALYGAAVVAVPGALMARGATSPLGLASPMASAASMLSWAVVKMAVSVVMLIVAPRVVPGLVWPWMLAALVVCLQTYWVALLWRGRRSNKN